MSRLKVPYCTSLIHLSLVFQWAPQEWEEHLFVLVNNLAHCDVTKGSNRTTIQVFPGQGNLLNACSADWYPYIDTCDTRCAPFRVPFSLKERKVSWMYQHQYERCHRWLSRSWMENSGIRHHYVLQIYWRIFMTINCGKLFTYYRNDIEPF